MEHSMIRVENLCKYFGERTAVDKLTMSIGKELFVFLGPNGAGKTTSIKMMTGLLAPHEGTVFLNGVNLQAAPLKAKKLFGLVHEEPVLYDKLTASEFIHFMARLYNVPKLEAEKRMNQLFEIFEMQDRTNDLLEDFSHGMKQKVALTGALIHDPEILFLDEPTVGLDPKSARNLKDLLRGLVEKGHTVFMSTHILEVAERMCDRIGIIHQGKLIAIGTFEELSQQSGKSGATLEDIFLALTGDTEQVGLERFLKEN
jgi:ABC-2 type transport system ATP-binding protein